MMKSYFEQTMTIDYRSVDQNLTIIPTQFISLLQETSLQHSQAIGFSMDWYKQNQKAFVLTHWQIEFYEHPAFAEEICIRTWPSHFKGVLGERMFEVCNKNNETILLANTKWIYMDLIKYKPIKISTDVSSCFGTTSPSLLESNFMVPEENLYTILHTCTITVTNSCIDSNNHVNNIKYIEWILDLLPSDVFFHKKMCSLTIEYKKETKLNMSLDVVLMIHKTESDHYLGIVKDKNNVYAKASFTYHTPRVTSKNLT